MIRQPDLVARIRQRQSLFRLAFDDRKVTRAMLRAQAEEFEAWLATLDPVPVFDETLRKAVTADPWSFNRGTLRERLDWCQMQHQVAADQGYETPQRGSPGYRDGPTNSRWHQDCADWYAEMLGILDQLLDI